jgi:outer membrane protein assembly factor BamB
MGGVLLVFGATAVAFWVPWLSARDGGAALPVSRYALFEDGAASLVRRSTAEGELIEWSSTAVELLPGIRALAELPPGFADAVAEQIAGQGAGVDDAFAEVDALRRSRVGVVHKRFLTADASTLTEVEVRVLDGRGLHSLGSQVVGDDAPPILIDPPLPLLPADPRPGASWSAEGTYGATPYQWAAEVIDRVPLPVELGRLDDCITVASTLTLETADGPSTLEFLDQYCAGAGWMHGEIDGGRGGRFDTLSVDGFAPAALPDPATQPGGPIGPPIDDSSSWELSRLGSALPPTSTGTATFTPVYLPTDPAAVLTATDAGGDLVAIAADGLTDSVIWRFPTAGAVYARPRYDPDTRRIYFGASDGLVRALDDRGLFLWSRHVGDNIATRPVIGDGIVVIGSENGQIHGLDADTGEVTWQVAASGAVVSSPTAAGGLVVIADEAGVVRGLDPRDGALRWSHTAGAPVEAPLAAWGNHVLVADRSGALTLLDQRGNVVWTTDAAAGFALRAEPAVTDGLVVTVDESGTAVATSLADGVETWRRMDAGYVGSAVVVGGTVVLARRDGSVDIVGIDGELVHSVKAGRDEVPAFTYGPAAGGGALWLADDGGTVHRLGAAREATALRYAAREEAP